VVYNSNDQIVKELKKLMIDNDVTQADIAKVHGTTRQNIGSILNKKNLSFADIDLMLSVFGYKLDIYFVKG